MAGRPQAQPEEANGESASMLGHSKNKSKVPLSDDPAFRGFGFGGISAQDWFKQHSLEVDGTNSNVGFKSRNAPEDEANWFSRLLFLYVDGMIKAGAKKHLEQDDLWDMGRKDEATRVYLQFNKELKTTVTAGKPQGVVWRAIWRNHGGLFIWSGVVKMVHDIIMFMPPFILERLLHHMAGGGSRLGALWWSCALLLVAVLENLSVNWYFHMLYRMSLHIKIEMIQMLYEKSLRITSAVKAEMGVGSIVNLQSNDASKLWNTPLYLHIVWNGPFQIFIVMAMLVRIMNWGPAMAGLVVTIIMIPLSTLVGRTLTKVRRAMVKQTDARVKLATEIITGIKAIKLYAWEDAYMERVSSLRDTELKHIRTTQLLSTLNTALFSAGPVFVALAAFSVHSLMGYSLTAAVAFPALSLFNLLRFPIVMFPSQVMNMIHAHVGLQRIQRFMEKEEMKPRVPTAVASSVVDSPFAPHQADDADMPLLLSQLETNASHHPAHALAPANGHISNGHISNGQMSNGHTSNGHMGKELESVAECESLAISVRCATFSWEAGTDPTLVDVSLSVEQGTLVMVVGQVGSGKSSLLSAILGEMHRLSGRIEVLGSMAYTSQDPWIQNSTVRNNVLMGKPYDDDHYTAVLAACMLGPDLEMLAAGDATEIGEKGVNLSGGQKHRVALARAVYSNADIFLLDDPLSAVDAHVGRALFDDCICGLLDGHTRVLVTHQLQYLPAADLVVVMAEGQIKEVGGYQELLDRGVDLNQFVKKSSSERNSSPGASVEPAADQDDALPVIKVVGDDANGDAADSPQIATSEQGAAHHEIADEAEPLGKGAVLQRVTAEANGASPHKAVPNGGPPALSVLLAGNDSMPRRTAFSAGEPLDSTPPATQKAKGRALIDVHFDNGTSFLESPGRDGWVNRNNQIPAVLDRSNSMLVRNTRLPYSVSVVGPVPDLGHVGSVDLKHHTSRKDMGALVEVRGERAQFRRTESRKALAGAQRDLRRMLTMKEQDGKIIKVEERAVGQVDKAIYKAYLAAWSSVWMLLPLAVVVLAFGERGLQVGQNYVLSFWTNDTAHAALEGRKPHTKRWLSLYFMLGMISIGCQMLRAAATVAGSISASRTLHKELMEKVVRLPMSFYDSQPTGRLLNRMTKDTESVDIQVSGSVSMALNCVVNAILSVLVISVVTPVALVALLPLAFLYYRIQAVYIASSRELKRLDALAFSPIFQHFSESLHGLTTIRAFGKQRMFVANSLTNLDSSNRAYWPIQVINRWLSVRLEMMGAFIVFVTAVSVAVIHPSTPGLVGLAVTSALNLTSVMNWMVRQMTELEVNMNSVERMVEYLKYDEEAPAEIESRRPPANWPHAGAIEARSLTVRYRPDLDPVLKNLSFKVYAREKIGVCGRTGCGKSTLMITLYRLVEPCGGAILIDDLDVSTIGLRDLRSRLSLVPQDPVIFSGTIRSNLDPFNTVKADADIWEALRRGGMDEYVRSQAGGLSAPIKEGGANLSVGQRQLLCMARALLRSSRILVLDEATSNVDNTTDGLIQSTIRSAFSDCTVLTIAHRLHTIIDSDRVLLLDAGTLAEFDTPHNLLQRPGSAFRRLVEETTKGGGLNAGAVADALAGAIEAANSSH